MMYGFYYYDYTYFLFMLPAFLIAMYAQIKVQYTFSKYSTIYNTRGLTGAQAAQRVLMNNNVTNVAIERVSGHLSDHYDPSTNVIRLSDDVYSSTSVAAAGVAAHEAGHAVQQNQGYLPIKIRSAMVPVTKLGSFLSMPIILLGLLLPVQYSFVVNIGIILFSMIVVFELITLPVEINASRRAIDTLEQTDTLYGEELDGAKEVLRAAAFTYLASVFSSAMSLLRILLITGNRRGRD